MMGCRILAGLVVTCVLHEALVAAEPTPPAEPDPRLKGGTQFKLEFPKLTVDRHGDTAAINVKLPKGYDLKKKYPLIVWLAGGEGGNSPGSANQLGDADQFITVGMPYPKGASNPNQSNMVGNYGVIWAYHKTMLDELNRVVPNINPELRVLSGFSNGGHCIDGQLRLPRSPWRPYFNVFVIADGGGDGGAYGPMAGCYAFLCWGETSPNKGRTQPLVQALARAGAQVKGVEEKGTGHAFAPEYVKQAHDWIKEVVIPGVAKQGVMKAEALVSTRPAEALAMTDALEPLVRGTELEPRVAGIAQKIDAAAQKELEAIKAGLAEGQPPAKKSSAVSKAKVFLKKYAGTKPGELCAALLADVGVK